MKRTFSDRRLPSPFYSNFPWADPEREGRQERGGRNLFKFHTVLYGISYCSLIVSSCNCCIRAMVGSRKKMETQIWCSKMEKQSSLSSHAPFEKGSFSQQTRASIWVQPKSGCTSRERFLQLAFSSLQHSVPRARTSCMRLPLILQPSRSPVSRPPLLQHSPEGQKQMRFCWIEQTRY